MSLTDQNTILEDYVFPVSVVFALYRYHLVLGKLIKLGYAFLIKRATDTPRSRFFIADKNNISNIQVVGLDVLNRLYVNIQEPI